MGEKNISNLSLSSIPLDRISVMAPSVGPQASEPSDDSDHGMEQYQQNVLKEEDESISEQNDDILMVNHKNNIIEHKQKRKNKVPSNDIIDKQELAEIFNLNEEEEQNEDDEDNEEVSDHEHEFDAKQHEKDKKK